VSAICGILSLTNSPPCLDLLARMLAALQQHGPDGSGQWHDGSVGLGHQMMHITPESLNEHLPLHHGESGISITFDGRLDNRDDLIQALGIPGSSDLPDSAVLLKAYQKWGADSVERLVGEFSFAVWDVRNHRLHCCADPMGIRPLFYSRISGKYFAFASEIRPLLAIDENRGLINDKRLAMLGVSALSVFLEPETTCFKNIFRIPAGTILSMDRNGIKTREYWAPDVTKRLRFNSDEECREAYQEVFFKSVKARLRSVYPVASFLSGGLDSSGIVSAASRIQAGKNEQLVTVSAVPMPSAQENVAGEKEFIDHFNKTENLDMQYVSAPNRGPFDQLEQLVESASLCSYSYQHYQYTALVEAATQKNARLILDGDGGELSASSNAAGYFAELMLTARWTTLLHELRQMDPNRAVHLSTFKRHVLRPMFPNPLLKWLNRHARFKQHIEYPIKAEFIRDTLGQDAEQVKDQVNHFLEEYPNHRKNMAEYIQRARIDIRQRSHAGFVGYQKARISYPYLDKRMLEFGLAVDGHFKYQNRQNRRLIRLGMDGLLPRKILSRTSKAPFCPDYHIRFERDKVRATRSLKDFSESGILGPIVDLQKISRALQSTPAYRPENPMRVDYESQFLIPYGVYMCYFLLGLRS